MKVDEKNTVKYLPYGRQHINDDDINAVVETLRSDWLTQGPTIEKFEKSLAVTVDGNHLVACSNGTAALHLTMLALGIGVGDFIVTTPNTFLADANCASYVGAEVIFADIDSETGNISVDTLAEILEADYEHKIKAVIPVHFAGQPVDLPLINRMVTAHGAVVIDDACHALGASYDDDETTYRVGSSVHSEMTVFSFHPVKHVAMGEGGAVATSNARLAERLRLFRNHGMDRSEFKNPKQALSPDGTPNPWYYEMQQPGFNYRLTDIQAALGISQLTRLGDSVKRRNEIASLYEKLIAEKFPDKTVIPLKKRVGVKHAYHLFVIKIDFDRFGVTRAKVMNQLRELGIGTQVHYIPIPLQPYYQKRESTFLYPCPNAEHYYERALSIPMYPTLTDDDIERVVSTLYQVLNGG